MNDQAPQQLVEHFFRHEHANLVAVLTRAFGVRRLDLVEDMVGTSMLQAMESWKQAGIPNNPAAWIHRVARNKILDSLRRERTHQQAVGFIESQAEARFSETPELIDRWLDEASLPDSLLRMLFVCCHPCLDREAQIALALRTLGGFSIAEVARGLLLNAETAKKRIQRAKKKLAAENISVELPSASEVLERLSVVHEVLYLMFNEGYSATRGASPIRDDVCEEAARLCHLLCEHKTLSTPESRALLALMLFHASRLEARTDSLGNVLLLEEQDRSQWDKDLIHVATSWLVRSASEEEPSRFQYEALIAQQHCTAESIEDTNWNTIVQLYNRLLERVASPVYRLNRAIAMCQAGDVQSALQEVQAIRDQGQLSDYYLLDCTSAYLSEKAGDWKAATDYWLSALSGDLAEHQRQVIHRQLERVSQVNLP